MKKIVLIPLILSCFLLNNLMSQETDSIFKASDFKIKYSKLKLNVGVMPGIELLAIDTAFVSVAIPSGINYRRYSKNNLAFGDVDVSVMGLVTNKNFYKRFIKYSIGYGTIFKSFNSEVHISYLQAYAIHNNFKDMFGFGYDMETHSIPLTIDFYFPNFKDNYNYFFLVGIKVPILTFNF
jgi:hypothetical protein